MKKLAIWRVAVPTPLRRCFDYLPCQVESDALAQAGMRVKVPFGSRTLVGMLVAVLDHTDIDPAKLKPVELVLDTAPIIDPVLLRLCHWASEYYHHSLGEVFASALPQYIRTGKVLTPPRVRKKKDSAVGHPSTDVVRDAGPLSLNPEQQHAVDVLLHQFGFAVSLLAGVTGSGKTEVYLQVIAAVLQRHQSALVLVPEINLTPQTVGRFQKRFGVPVAVMHSGLSDRARAQLWWQVQEGQFSIVIGTRSAIFAPLKNLGVIVIDEEHDPSFKSQSQLRYSARDVAVMRAKMHDIPVILGSATPSLETYYHAQRGHYILLILSTRANVAQLPLTTVVDVCDQPLQAGLSATLIDAMRQQLMQKKQVLLFLNRRGYAPIMMCHHCRYIVSCTRCDAKMTLHHKPRRLICHHCDRTITPVRICPQCHQADLVTISQGTEQLEDILQPVFPDARIVRMDRDTVVNAKDLHEKLEQIYAGEADILIGTQMLAKGHHFPKVGLSALVDIDSSFFSIDFRAIERLAQLIMQVGGRAGREAEQGHVMIQTQQPQHPYLKLLLQHDYFAVMKALLAERQGAGLPPFSFQVAVWAQSTHQEAPITHLTAVKQYCQSHTGIQVFGPMPATMERRAGYFRQVLIIQSKSRPLLKKSLSALCAWLDATPVKRSLRCWIDVDPIETG